MSIKSFTILLACFCLTKLHGQTIKTPFTIDGAVNASVQKGDTVFIGGTFTSIQSPENMIQYGGLADLVTGEPNLGWPEPNGPVTAAISDGYGGFYIGGSFTMVGNETRTRIAHIDQYGVLTQQLQGVSFGDAINTLQLKNNILYVGGNFTTVGDNNTPSIGRNRLAAIDLGLNAITAWNPNSGNVVNSIAIKGDSLYAGGHFVAMGGVSRTYLAVVSLATGAVGNWAPVIAAGTGATGLQVTKVLVSGDTLYVSGRFTTFDGQNRNKLVAVVANTLLPWNPDIGGALASTVTAMDISGNLLYVGGGFDSIGTGSGTLHRGLAAIDRSTGLPTNWNPAIPAGFGGINSILLHNGALYVAGNFSGASNTIGGAKRLRIAALNVNLDTLMAMQWNPIIQDVYPQCLAISGNKLYVGGHFTRFGKSLSRNKLAAFRPSNNTILDWNPNATGNITALGLSRNGQTIYAAGDQLTAIASNPVGRMASIDAITGTCNTGWVTDIGSGGINTIVSSDNAVYVGGSFTTVATLPYNRLVALDPATGAPSTWNPGANSTIYALALREDTLYVGGAFTQVGNPLTTRNRLAAISTATGGVGTWNPNLSGGSTPEVKSLLIRDSLLYIGGSYTTIMTQTRARISAVNLKNKTLLATWNPNSNNNVNFLASAGNALYLGGAFTSFGGTASIPRPGIALLDATSGTLSTSWNPSAFTGTITSLFYINHTLYAGLNATPFLVSLSGDQALPVSFSSVAAAKQGEDVVVRWSTASEINNSHFNLERSTEGTGFTPIHSLGRSGTSLIAKSYAATDRTPFVATASSVLYYRIRQVDFNGQSSYSDIVRVQNEQVNIEAGFSVYPNPAKDAVTIEFKKTLGDKNIEVFNLNGKKMYSVSSDKQAETLLLNDFAAGIYLVKVTTVDGVVTRRLIIGH